MEGLSPTNVRRGTVNMAAMQRALLERGSAIREAPSPEVRFARLRPTPLLPFEADMAASVWDMYVGHGGFVKDEAMLRQLVLAVQLPAIAIIEELCSAKFRGKLTNFSYIDFCNLLELCKTVHCRWLGKVRGKSLDDDLLEAFVAVGGAEDTSGIVDLGQLRHVITEFNLDVDLEKILNEIDSDGSRMIEFSEFVELLRYQAQASAAANSDGAGAAMDASTNKRPVTLSRQITLDEVADLDLVVGGRPLGMAATDLGNRSLRGMIGLSPSNFQSGGGTAAKLAQGRTPNVTTFSPGVAGGRKSLGPAGETPGNGGNLAGTTSSSGAGATGNARASNGNSNAPPLGAGFQAFGGRGEHGTALPVYKGSGGLRTGHGKQRMARSPSPTPFPSRAAVKVAAAPAAAAAPGKMLPPIHGKRSQSPRKWKFQNGD